MTYEVELELKIEAKSYALSDEEYMTLVPFLLVGRDPLPILLIWVMIFFFQPWPGHEQLHFSFSRTFMYRLRAVLNAKNIVLCDRYIKYLLG